MSRNFLEVSDEKCRVNPVVEEQTADANCSEIHLHSMFKVETKLWCRA